MKPEELNRTVTALHELDLSYQETLDLMSGVTKELSSARRRLWTGGKPSRSLLVKIGLTLFVFPVPVVSEVLGATLISAGVIHSRIRKPPLHIEDVYKTFQGVSRELQKIRRESL